MAARLVARPLGLVHLAWAILVLVGCVVLLMTPGGHPPAMILVPPLLAAGIVGHGLLLLVAWLVRRGRARLAAIWPAELVLAAMVLGVLSVGLTALVVAWWANAEGERTSSWPWGAAAALHAAAFVTLLLRLPAARFLIAAVASGWGIALALRLPRASAGELPMATTVVAGLLGIAAYVLRSRRIRSALA